MTQNQAKIFISSPHQKQLIPYRRTLIDNIEGHFYHKAVYWEAEDFADKDPTQQCLQLVEESDLFVLLLADNIGRISKDGFHTITHLEYKTAAQNKIPMLFYIDPDVKQAYFEIFPLIDRGVAAFHRNHDREANDYELLQEIIKKLSDLFPLEMSDYKQYNPYLWYFLYDIMHPTEQFLRDLDEVLDRQKFGHCLSHFLKKGCGYIGDAAFFDLSAELVNDFDNYQSFTRHAIKLMKNGKINNESLRDLLYLYKDIFSGGKITVGQSKYHPYEVGVLKPCSAITIYCEENEQLVQLAKAGLASESNFPLVDTDSFVVETFKRKTDDVYFEGWKNIIYFTQFVDPYVLCLHFPVSGNLTEQTVSHYREDIIRVIINERTSAFIDFTKSLLGGVQRDHKIQSI